MTSPQASSPMTPKMTDATTAEEVSRLTREFIIEANQWKTKALVAEQKLIASQEENVLLRNMLAHTNSLLDALMQERESFFSRQAASKPFFTPVLPSKLS